MAVIPRTIGWVEHELNGTRDPLVTDDSSLVFSTGSIWVNTISGQVFICADPSDGEAIWTDLSSAIAFASQAEVDAGIISNKAISPETLSNFNFGSAQKDIQYKHGSSASTNADPWVDIPGLNITTSSSSALNYTLDLGATWKVSKNGNISFRLICDGELVPGTYRTINTKHTNALFNISIAGYVESVGSGKIIKAQYGVSKGTLSLDQFNLLVQGG